MPILPILCVREKPEGSTQHILQENERKWIDLFVFLFDKVIISTGVLKE